jgi:hypothetical protein
MRKPPRKDDYGKLSEDMPKQEAIDRVNQRYRPGKLNNDNTHFANINHGDDVWWLDIPLKKVRVPAAEDSLHLLLYDFRTRKLHHLRVPTLFLRDNSNNTKLFVRVRKDTIHLHLWANRADHKFFQDVKVHKGGLHFAQFEQHPALETS